MVVDISSGVLGLGEPAELRDNEIKERDSDGPTDVTSVSKFIKEFHVRIGTLSYILFHLYKMCEFVYFLINNCSVAVLISNHQNLSQLETACIYTWKHVLPNNCCPIPNN